MLILPYPLTSTTHNLFSISKTAIFPLEIRGGGVVEETRAQSNTETNKESQFAKST